MDIKELLYQNEHKDLLRFSTAGSVDDGKSTLIGRLLYDSKTLYDDHLSSLKKDSIKKGSAGGEIDYSLLLDGLKAEREQGITIDVAYRFFSTPKRKFIIADTPGHEQYTRNMATGASTADLAVILIDASKGILPQTKRHTFISSLLGIQHILVAVNKMDIVNYDIKVFEKIREDYVGFAAKLQTKDIHFIPISALKGDNVVDKSENMSWYKGPSFLNFIENIHIASDRNLIDLRLPVQYVNRPDINFRGFCGQLASGIIRKGDKIIALPSGKKSKVKAIESFSGQIGEAFAPMSINITLEDEIDISRGDIITHENNLPTARKFIDAIVVWLHENPMQTGKKYLIRQINKTTPGTISNCFYKFNINTLSKVETTSLALNEIGRVSIDMNRDILFDAYSVNKITGSFIIIDFVSNLTVGAGMITTHSTTETLEHIVKDEYKKNIKQKQNLVTTLEKEKMLNQKSATIWFTGLPKTGKSSIAFALEKRLFDLGYLSTVLDGENMRLSIGQGLGFTNDARSENSRRTAAVAKLFNDTGLISIVSLITPFEADREDAAKVIGNERFILIHLTAPQEVRELRDNENLYKKARENDIREFTGITSPYEIPQKADILIDTSKSSIEDSVESIIRHIKAKKILKNV